MSGATGTREAPPDAARQNLEVRAAPDGDGLALDARDRGAGRGPVRQLIDKAIDLGGFALELDDDTAGVVADEAPQSALRGEGVGKGAKPHALHHPFDAQPAPDPGRRAAEGAGLSAGSARHGSPPEGGCAPAAPPPAPAPAPALTPGGVIAARG